MGGGGGDGRHLGRFAEPGAHGQGWVRTEKQEVMSAETDAVARGGCCRDWGVLSRSTEGERKLRGREEMCWIASTSILVASRRFGA